VKSARNPVPGPPSALKSFTWERFAGLLVERWSDDGLELLGMAACDDLDDAALAVAFEVREDLA
jgi:hypothetical protein